jgi:hypothetical protein
MATPTVQAFKFIFEADKMQALLDTKPGKVICVVSIEEVTTADGKKAGALKIIARGPEAEAEAKGGGLEIPGCPDPPCKEQ